VTNEIDGRHHTRYEIVRPTLIIPRAAEAIQGITQNISRGGMLVAVAIELELDRTYRIELSDVPEALSLYGEALRLHLPHRNPDGSQEGGFKVGFEFLGLDDSTAARLDRLLQEATI